MWRHSTRGKFQGVICLVQAVWNMQNLGLACQLLTLIVLLLQPEWSSSTPASLDELTDVDFEAVQMQHSHANFLGTVLNHCSIAVAALCGC